jgi:hypothetical protein
MGDASARQLQMHAEDLMLLMNASKVKKDDPLFGGYPLPLRTFDKAEPWTNVGLEIARDARPEDSDIFTDAWPEDLPGGVNIALLAPLSDPSECGGAEVVVRRYRSVRRPLLPVKTLARHIVAEQRLFLNRSTGVGHTSIRYYGINRRDREGWIDLQRGVPLIEVDPGETTALWVALGVQFNRDYLWHAYLKLPGAEAGVMTPVTPSGARSLFKLRDYEAGSSRRKALIHWVSEHSRRIRKDTEEETRIWVREHTRGAAKFRWQDMEGAIYPAAHDLRRLAARP